MRKNEDRKSQIYAEKNGSWSGRNDNKCKRGFYSVNLPYFYAFASLNWISLVRTRPCQKHFGITRDFNSKAQSIVLLHWYGVLRLWYKYRKSDGMNESVFSLCIIPIFILCFMPSFTYPSIIFHATLNSSTCLEIWQVE